MADPQALDGLSWDERQELKEAVCDAVLERARQVVTGDGAYGSVILNERPSRKLSSGFIPPTLNVYVRALPSSGEMFARNGWLMPQADFNQGAKTRIKDAINQRARAE